MSTAASSSLARFAPWRWPVSVHRRLVRVEERTNEIANQIGHLTQVANQINHTVNDLSQRMADHRADTETIAALSLTFRRFAADITAHLDEVIATLPAPHVSGVVASVSDGDPTEKLERDLDGSR